MASVEGGDQSLDMSMDVSLEEEEVVVEAEVL